MALVKGAKAARAATITWAVKAATAEKTTRHIKTAWATQAATATKTAMAANYTVWAPRQGLMEASFELSSLETLIGSFSGPGGPQQLLSNFPAPWLCTGQLEFR